MKERNVSRQSQMNRADPRLTNLFQHVRAIVDILEALTRSPLQSERKPLLRKFPLLCPAPLNSKS